MKLRVEMKINENAITLKEYHNCSDILEYYNKYYKKGGFKFDKLNESIYYDTEVQFMPIEGQRIGTKFFTGIVEYACYELHPSYEKNNYYGMSLIIVREE